MTISSAFPYATREVDNTWIPLSDGTRLAARLWLPELPGGAGAPAILEYLPYRKDDETADNDATRHPYFAGHGFASVRVDLRGCGDSDGVITDEYSAQEHADALEAIAWIAEQPWCNGSVGMIGYSWGGFNGLQVAALRPPALKAIVTVYSTDDRYLDDCHYMGGCLLGSDMLKWASWMRAINALPPDPRFRDDWRDVWLERLRETPAFIEPWVTHQTRDSYWKHGSVAEDYSAIEAATLVVGGWTDAYTNAVPRLLEHLTCVRRGIIGPWAHVMPYYGVPGPAIGFLQECVRWFGRWLDDRDTGVERDPLLRAYLAERTEPSPSLAEIPGSWIAQDAWPPAHTETVQWAFAQGALVPDPPSGSPSGAAADPPSTPGASAALIPPDAQRDAPSVVVATPQHCGSTAGVWCANGLDDELAIDQAADDALSVCFDAPGLERAMDVLGVPAVRLAVSSDRPAASIAVRLTELLPSGESLLVTWGMLNLTHRDSHETPCALEPGTRYDVRVPLNAIGRRFEQGARLRLAVSSAYWPHAWPHPHAAAVTLHLDGCLLELPVLTQPAACPDAFSEAEHAPHLAQESAVTRTRARSVDPESGVHSIIDTQRHSTILPWVATTWDVTDGYHIHPEDPLSATASTTRRVTLDREGWHVRVESHARMTATATTFEIEDLLEAWEGTEKVFSRKQRFDVERHSL